LVNFCTARPQGAGGRANHRRMPDFCYNPFGATSHEVHVDIAVKLNVVVAFVAFIFLSAIVLGAF
jgi:hypothetical protein